MSLGEIKDGKLIAISPSTLEKIGEVKVVPPQDVEKHVERARKAFPGWKALSFRERAEYIFAAKNYILAHLDKLADLMVLENGKPKVEALNSDLFVGLEVMTYFAKRGERILRDEPVRNPQMYFKEKRHYICYEPVGVVGVIAPWNFPFSISMSGVSMALLAGNTVLLKPSPHTCLIGEKFSEIFQSAGLPEGVFQALPGGNDTGEALVKANIDKIVFTGSVRTGKRIMETCAPHLRPLMLELGGKDPMLVREDADLEAAASGAVWGAFTNCGQVCASVERVYVNKKIAKVFIDRVVEKTSKLRVGDPSRDSMDVGPMISMEQLKIVESHLSEAQEKGAKVLVGGKRIEGLKGYFIQPAVLANVNHTMRIMKEETFGPALPIMEVENDGEAVALANDSEYGLCASVWSRDVREAERMAQQIETGLVTVNDALYGYAVPQIPWGGVKYSSLGHSHAEMGLKEFVHPKTVSIDKGFMKKKMYWYPYSEKTTQLMRKTMQFVFGKGISKIKF